MQNASPGCFYWGLEGKGLRFRAYAFPVLDVTKPRMICIIRNLRKCGSKGELWDMQHFVDQS